jgi:hypothetical protein
LAKLVVEIESVCVAAATVMLSACVAALLLASVSFTVNEDVPDPVGVPEITPDEPFRTNPAGNAPLLMLQVYGVVPPVACSVTE